jgi:hypothetical protein
MISSTLWLHAPLTLADHFTRVLTSGRDIPTLCQLSALFMQKKRIG